MSEFNIWNHFEKVIDTTDMKKSRCMICDKILNHTSTIYNLKSHIRFQHPDLISEEAFLETSNYRTTRQTRSQNMFVWEYFTKTEGSDKLALYKTCNKKFSYKATITNLKSHLLNVHIDELEIRGEEKAGSDSPSSIHTDPEAQFLDCKVGEYPRRTVIISASRLYPC